ncbi:MAG TPA: metal-sensing transcriptional repressor [Acholeplasmataceae bacterium]|jgi:DNA-binding FrmR family transcriptional regulator|nr:metal-sensing transcriptional repressor [Acholeplasmataceae bacterium]
MNEQKKKAIFSLKTARGQIDSVINMIEEGRYCIDISNQVMAVMSLLKKANLLVLEQHLNHCVKEAFEKGNSEEKTKEILNIISRMSGK